MVGPQDMKAEAINQCLRDLNYPSPHPQTTALSTALIQIRLNACSWKDGTSNKPAESIC